MRKAKILIEGFSTKEISKEAGVALYTAVLYAKRGGRTKGPKIEAAISRLKIKRLQTLQAELEQLKSSLQNQ